MEEKRSYTVSHYKLKLISAVAVALLVAAGPAVARADTGAAVYKAKCASCHGPDGSGSTPVGKSLKLSDLRSAEVQKQTDAELTKIISDGKGKMQPYGKKLTADEIKSLVTYLRTLKK